MISSTIAMMEAHISSLRLMKASLEKVRPKLPKELVDQCSNAVADARELKSAAAYMFKTDGAIIAKISSAKRAKDPNAPKRPLSGYTLFVKQASSDIRAAAPGTDAVEVMKLCGAKWQALSADQKAVG